MRASSLLLAIGGAHAGAPIGAQSARRFLMLPGSGTTAGAFLNSPTALGAKEFLSGVPRRVDANSPAIPPNWLYTALDAGSADGGWYGDGFSGMQASVAAVEEEIESSASVGLIGHEQGATLAAIVAARAALGEGPPLTFAVICGGCLPESGPYADLLQRLRDTPDASIATLHCIGNDEMQAEAEALAACFGPSAEVLRHERGGAMPPRTWWEQTRGFPERVTGGNRWVTQFKGPFFYSKEERAAAA